MKDTDSDITNSDTNTTFATMPRTKFVKKQSHQTYLEMPQAIFIHAGAGFHSVQNEKIHLSVCSRYVRPLPPSSVSEHY